MLEIVLTSMGRDDSLWIGIVFGADFGRSLGDVTIENSFGLMVLVR